LDRRILRNYNRTKRARSRSIFTFSIVASIKPDVNKAEAHEEISVKKNLLYAFKRTIPILAGFFPLGLAYGMPHDEGWLQLSLDGFTCVTVLAGSLQF
jgi:hypothetical protein